MKEATAVWHRPVIALDQRVFERSDFTVHRFRLAPAFHRGEQSKLAPPGSTPTATARPVVHVDIGIS